MEYKTKTKKSTSYSTLCAVYCLQIKKAPIGASIIYQFRPKLTNQKVIFMQHLTAAEQLKCLKLFRKS